jgi:hypothetical protein
VPSAEQPDQLKELLTVPAGLTIGAGPTAAWPNPADWDGVSGGAGRLGDARESVSTTGSCPPSSQVG